MGKLLSLQKPFRRILMETAVKPEACPTLTKGEYRYDYGDTAKLTPLTNKERFLKQQLSLPERKV